jgi:hypothetical protein
MPNVEITRLRGHSQAGGAVVVGGVVFGGVVVVGGVVVGQAENRGSATNTNIRQMLPISIKNLLFFMDKTSYKILVCWIFSSTSSVTSLHCIY